MTLGQVAFEAYFKRFLERPSPIPWAELGDEVQAAWEHAGEEVVRFTAANAPSDAVGAYLRSLLPLASRALSGDRRRQSS